MAQIFGDFNERLPQSQEGLTIVFSPTSISVKQRWRNNGLSADFMADYFATFFSASEEPDGGTDSKAEVKSAVSFIANELIENAMKFSDETSSYPISIKLQMHEGSLIFLASNSISPQEVDKFQAYLKELTTCDPNEMYIYQLEKSAEETVGQSGLGFLTMMNDYQAQLGWKFETVEAAIAVTTMVQLTV